MLKLHKANKNYRFNDK